MIITANGTTRTFERKICIHFGARGSEHKYAYTFWRYLFFASRFLCEYFYLTWILIGLAFLSLGAEILCLFWLRTFIVAVYRSLWSKKIKTFLDHCPFISEIFFPFHGWRNMSVTLRRLIFSKPSSALEQRSIVATEFSFHHLNDFHHQDDVFCNYANCFTSNLIIISVR